MSDWIERKNWSCPVPLGSYVEVCGHDKTQVKRGEAVEFNWGYDPDGEGSIHYYKVLSSFDKCAKQLQTKIVEVSLPYNQTLMEFPDEKACGLFMIWWGKQGAKQFYKWHDSLRTDDIHNILIKSTEEDNNE